MSAEKCQCCDFGNHREPCTCDGESCCHPAYAALYGFLADGKPGVNNYPALIDAFEAEVLRDAAKKIRMAPFSEYLLQRHQRYAAARIIDPEVTK